MYTFLLIVLVINSLVLVAAILLQSGKGGGLAASFGGAASSADAWIGSRQATTILTKITWWGAGVFLGLALVLQLMVARAPSGPRQSLLEKSLGGSPTSTQKPGTGGGTPTPLTSPQSGSGSGGTQSTPPKK